MLALKCQVAASHGIHPGRLSEIECGWREPSPELLARLHKLLREASDGKEIQP